MDEMTDWIYEPKSQEEWADSFGPTSWNDMLNDIAVSLAMAGRQPSKIRVAEIAIEIAEVEGNGERIPQQIRDMLIPEKKLTEEEQYLDRIGV